jgi:hypothetical protein
MSREGDAEETVDRIPDGITPIVAYRMWLVDHHGTIKSPMGNLRWAAGDWVTARCRRAGDDPGTDPPGHRAPAEGCTCGIYALKSPGGVTRLMTRFGDGYLPSFAPIPASGVVELSGKVIEHALGYRAERARIVTLVPVQWRPRRREPVRSAPRGTSSSAQVGSAATGAGFLPRLSGRKPFAAWSRLAARAMGWTLWWAFLFGLVYWFGQWRHGS